MPRRFGTLLTGHAVTTVPRVGWAGVKNGNLLSLIDGAFEAFVTLDKNLAWQNPTSSLRFGIIVLKARSNRIGDVGALAPMVMSALATLAPGQLIYLP